MTNALGAKPVVDTSEFKARLKEMNADLRVLESGFRANTASMGDWANSGTGLEMRMKSLNAQMDVQRQKVALLKEEYERVKAEKGEDAQATKNAEVELNKATETLGKMENELGQTESALNSMGEETEETGEKVHDAGNRWEGFKTVLSGVGGVVKGVVTAIIGMVAAIAAVAAAVAGLVFSSASAAGELVDLSAKTGISTTALQEMKFIGEQVGVSLDTIATSQARLTRSMATAAEGTNDASKAFDRLGVSVTNSDGTLRSQQDVMAEVLTALNGIENAAERDALAMQIFGRGAMELNPLIGLSADEMARLTDEAHRLGAVMSEEDVAALEAFDDMVAGLKLGLKGLGGSLASAFLPIFQRLADGARQFLQDVGPILSFIINRIEGVASGNIRITDIISEMGEALRSINWGEIRQNLTSIDWGQVSQKLIDGIRSIDWNALGLTLGEVLKTAFAVIKDIVAETDWGGLFSSIGIAFMEFSTGLGGGSMDEFISTWQGNIKALEQIFGNIKRILTEKSKEFLSVGKAIVEGVWKGIQAQRAKFEEQIREFFESIINAVKDALGIESPSKKFAEIGVNSMLGYRMGILSEMEKLQEFMAGAFGGLTFSPAFAPSMPGAGMGSGGSVTNVTINGITFQNVGRDISLDELLKRFNL